MLDRGRVWRPLDGQTDPSWRRSFGDAPSPLVPRYLRRGVEERMLADGSVMTAAGRDAGADAARSARALRGRGCRDLPAQLVRQPGPRASPSRARRGRCSATSRSRSPRRPRRSPRSTRAHPPPSSTSSCKASSPSTRTSSTRSCASSASPATSTSPTAPRRCCRGRRRSSSRSGSSSPGLRRARSRASASARRPATATCSAADVGGTSTDVSLIVDGQPFVEQHVRARARPDHQRALRRDLERRRRAAAASSAISPSGDVRWGPAAPARSPGPPATAGAAPSRPSPTPAC